MNGEVCCILGICCPPDERRTKVVKALAQDLGWSDDDAAAAFDWFAERVDFGPKGTVQPGIDAVAEMARAHPK